MVMICLAVAVVIGVLIGFVTLCVVWTMRVVSQSVRDRSLTLLSTYDGLLEDRSAQLKELDQELARARAELEQVKQSGQPEAPAAEAEEPEGDPMAFLKAVERISGTEYRDAGGGTLYRKIRENFDLTPEDVLPSFTTGPVRQGGPAGRLLEKLEYEAVYRLSTLPREEQRELLSQVLGPEERELLSEYTSVHRQFDSIAFYDYLQCRAAAEPGGVCLRVPPTAPRGRYPGQVQVVVDEEICEGFQVEADNILYDYCVKMREMGE